MTETQNKTKRKRPRHGDSHGYEPHHRCQSITSTLTKLTNENWHSFPNYSNVKHTCLILLSRSHNCTQRTVQEQIEKVEAEWNVKPSLYGNCLHFSTIPAGRTPVLPVPSTPKQPHWHHHHRWPNNIYTFLRHKKWNSNRAKWRIRWMAERINTAITDRCCGNNRCEHSTTFFFGSCGVGTKGCQCRPCKITFHVLDYPFVVTRKGTSEAIYGTTWIQ